MNYNLNQPGEKQPAKPSTAAQVKKLLALMSGERKVFIFALLAVLLNSTLNLAGPLVVGYTIDHHVQSKQYHMVLVFAGILCAMYLVAFVTSYLQTRLMGGIGQRILFNTRNALFQKLQELPVAFFNQNKAGDLISRINNDTDKLNLFLSQSLMQFVSSIFLMTGASIFLLSINFRLGTTALAPAVLLFILTRAVSPWIRKRNAVNLQTVGGMSAEIQESLNNFKVIVAFNRKDYFRQRFEEVNQQNYTTAIRAGVANTIFIPVYGLMAHMGQLLVLAFGIYFITTGAFTVGLLISFLSYVNSFYNPLRQLAAVWTNFQLAMAGWDRISQILSLETDLVTIGEAVETTSPAVISFQNVSFGYPNGKEVLHHVSFTLEKGKTYALVGPTGGGKTTTASLIARLYDPITGVVLLDGKDIRSYGAAERTKKIGFILQDPFLFTGTVRENILYGNEQYRNFSNEQLTQLLKEENLGGLLQQFEAGLDTAVQSGGESISLGQKQLVAFIRAVLRKPDLLILDEASANIDTMTEQLLEGILKKLPGETTRVIIAHRLNTIENADEIFFVNSGEITRAGSFQHAMDLLLHGKRES
ncbi:ABC transporter ATP-binding protein [Flavisolibacter nicotianae]|uniref:ABC transporter ATP-binding protein n=1 Tax=Flavisolibacter nicotianae TaxID=2364882 RepID=UPI000EB38AB4|nr:ABC transporter ATP-binding protein [Flavisolibacter nicotianae]